MSRTRSGGFSIRRSSRAARARTAISARSTSVDRYTVTFHLRTPSASFPINLVMGIVPAGTGAAAGASAGRQRPVSARASSCPTTTSRSTPFAEALRRARRATPGSSFSVVPDETMRGLELRKGSVDLVVNDLSPDLVHGLRESPAACSHRPAPGTDYAYLGFNLRDPLLADRARAAGHRLRDRPQTRSSRTFAAASRSRPRASCRRCPGRTRPTCSASRTTRPRPGAARRGRVTRIPTAPGPRLRLQADAQDVDRRALPAAGGRHPAEPRPTSASRSTCGRTSSRRSWPTSSGQRAALHAAVRRRHRSGHAAARVPLHADAARRIQPRPLRAIRRSIG